ncbi:hypothetical protein KJ885_03370 [Patescibacteria group bacterium]|nr:hypothetical protein [Patescibacteria group bacterium]
MNIKDLMKLRAEDLKKLKRPNHFVIWIIAGVAIVILGGVSLFLFLKMKSLPEVSIPEEQSATSSQAQELDALRQQASQQDFSKEDINNQNKELDKLRNQVKDSGPASKEEMERQAEELDNLRLKSQ